MKNTDISGLKTFCKSFFDLGNREPNEKYGFIDGSREQLWLATDGTLGIDATNPAWIESGRACPKEYGLYPLSWTNLKQCVLVEKFEKKRRDNE